MLKLLKYSLLDIVKSRFALLYTLFLVLVAISIYQVSEDMSKVSLSLLNIMLMIVPLIAAIFATTHFFNNLEFTELMLAQPVKRRNVFLSQILAVVVVLSLAIIIGFGIPMILWGGGCHGAHPAWHWDWAEYSLCRSCFYGFRDDPGQGQGNWHQFVFLDLFLSGI